MHAPICVSKIVQLLGFSGKLHRSTYSHELKDEGTVVLGSALARWIFFGVRLKDIDGSNTIKDFSSGCFARNRRFC